jgi:hypothetical protein
MMRQRLRQPGSFTGSNGRRLQLRGKQRHEHAAERDRQREIDERDR